jgi:hypothetical protein
VRVQRAPIVVDTRAALALSVVQDNAKGPQTVLSVDAARVQVSALSSPKVTDTSTALAVAERVQSQVTFHELDVTRDIEPLSTRLDVPAVTIRHLERFERFIPGKRSWRLMGGGVQAEGTFQSYQGVTQAHLSGDFAALQVQLAEHHLKGFGKLSLSYGANQSQRTSQLDHAEISFNTLKTRSGEEHTEDWWASVSTSRLQLTGPAGPQLSGTVVARAKNPEPVRQALGIPGIAKMVIPNKPLEVVAKLEPRGDLQRMQLLHAQTGSLTVAGELWSGERCRAGAFRVDGIPIPVGVALQDDDSELTWFASNVWLTEHLRDLDCRPQLKGIAQRNP